MRCIGVILGVLVFFVCIPLARAAHFVIGSENINYFPHYRFVEGHSDKGYAWAVIQAFAKKSGHTFEYQALPVKRLKRELQAGRVDFIYPDNPNWQGKVQLQSDKIFSRSFITSYGNTMVLAKRKNQSLTNFKLIAVPHGFTPVMYDELVAKGRIQLVEVPDAFSALKLVLLERVDGADVEFNVANYLTLQMGHEGAVSQNLRLPSDPATFHLSPRKHPHVIEQLNQFLSANTALIKDLKSTYQLIEPNQTSQ